MSKKSKKAQEAQIQEPSTTIGDENQVESVPATIVEAGEAEAFAAELAVANVEGGEAAVATEEQEAKSVEQATQLEQPAPKKPRADKRPFIPWLTEKLETPQDRKLLLKTILEKWPTVSKGGVQTFLTDMLNAKYTFYKGRPVVKLADGKVVFADKVPVAEGVHELPAEEASPQAEEASELPAE